MSGAEGEVPAGQPSLTWALHDQLAKLTEYNPREVVGERRMGADLSFENAERAVRDVTEIVEELRLDWDRIGPTKQAEIAGQVGAFANLIDSLLKMTSAAIDSTVQGTTWTGDQIRQQRDVWWNEVNRFHEWFLDNVRPICVSAPARRAAQDYIEQESASLSEEQVRELRQTFAELKEQAQDFDRMKPVVEAQRALLGEAGTTRLSGHFDDEATTHATAWKRWLAGLVA